MENDEELEIRSVVLRKSHCVKYVFYVMHCPAELNMFHSTGESKEQNAEKDGQIQILEKELVNSLLRKCLYSLCTCNINIAEQTTCILLFLGHQIKVH